MLTKAHPIDGQLSDGLSSSNDSINGYQWISINDCLLFIPNIPRCPRLLDCLTYPAWLEADLMETLHHSLMANADQRCTALLESLEECRRMGMPQDVIHDQLDID